jgi:putative MFS transporter
VLMSASQQTVGGEVSLTRNERLDRLPFNKAHRKLFVASGIGWAFDAMDVGLVSFVVAAIAADPHFNLTPTEKSWVLSIGFVGMAIGAALGGFVADRVGRKTVFTATLIIFGIANGAMALSWSLRHALRRPTGHRPRPGRRTAGRLHAGLRILADQTARPHDGAAGIVLGRRLDRRRHDRLFRDSEHRRLGLALGAAHRRAAAALRNRHARAHPRVRAIPRSQGSRRRSRAGRALLRTSRGRRPGNHLPKGKPLPKIKTRELFGKKYLARTAAIWATWFFVNFSYYGAFTWMPSLLADQFGSLTKSFGYTLAISIAQLPGYFLAAWLVEVWGRRKTLSVFLAVSAVAAFAVLASRIGGRSCCASACCCPPPTWVRGACCTR